MLLEKADLVSVSADLARLAPVAVLRLLGEHFGDRAAILSSMQRAGTALCHMADRAGVHMDVVFVDTGVLHPETLATRDRLAETHPNLRVRTLAPSETFGEQTRRRGLLYVSKEGQEACCDLRKSAPLRAVRGDYDVLVGALRRDEGGRRSQIGSIELDVELGLLRVHPFAHMTRAELDEYVRQNDDIVINPLHAMGFATIGCFPCTTPIRPDEDERAGRWRHLADVAYCGINPTDLTHGDSGPRLEISEKCAGFFDAVRSHAKNLAIPGAQTIGRSP